MECRTCNGMRFTSRQERKKWYQDGTWCYMGSQVQTVTELCVECLGTGRAQDPAANPDCSQCKGTGEMVVGDGAGCIDFDLCTCRVPAQPFNLVEAAYLGGVK